MQSTTSNPVIVGVDTSERARDAVSLGRLLAPALGAELVIAHAFPYDERRSRFASVGYERLLREDADQCLQGLAEVAGPAARMVALPDTSPARGLHLLAEREQAQLLITASSHRGRIGSTFLGNVAQQTLHSSPCAVAVAPLGYGSTARGAVAAIGIGFDGEEESDAALAFGAGLATSLNAELRLLGSSYIAPVVGSAGLVAYDMAPMQRAAEDDLRKQVDQAVREQAVACRGEVTDRPAVTELLRLSREVDLLVLGSRRFGPARRLLAGSTSDAVVREAACPVLVLPRGAELPATGDRPVAEEMALGAG